MWTDYLDFVLRIERAGRHYRVEAEGAGGEAQSPFELPFTDDEISDFVAGVDAMSTATGGGPIPDPVQETIVFGQRLYAALFQGAVRDVFVKARHSAEMQRKGLRIKLRLIGVPELSRVPWEMLYDGRDFIALSTASPLVRYLDLPNPPRPMHMQLPLRVLITISSPNDQSPLDVDGERERIQEALAGLVAQGLVEVDFTAGATLNALRLALSKARSQDRPYHAWHYIGHGYFDRGSSSVLAFTNQTGYTAPVNGFQLGTLFNSYPEIRLALLNACEGARASGDDPFAGVAAALVERGISAVVGMQFEIGDSAAVTLSEEFYRSLASGLPVDTALTEARRAVFFAPNWVEWATPVLFMRVRDGRLFTLEVRDKPPVDLEEEPTGEQTPTDGSGLTGLIKGLFGGSTNREGRGAVNGGGVNWGAFGEAVSARLTPGGSSGHTPEPSEYTVDADDDTRHITRVMPVTRTSDITYVPLPNLPGPRDTHLLKEPWRIVLELYNGEKNPPLVGLALYGDVILGRGRGKGETLVFGLEKHGARERGVSREHVLLRPTLEGLFLLDQDSTNKTLVNGEYCPPGVPVPLHHNDTLRFGRLNASLFVISSPADRY